MEYFTVLFNINIKSAVYTYKAYLGKLMQTFTYILNAHTYCIHTCKHIHRDRGRCISEDKMIAA